MQESIDISSKVFSELKEILKKLSDCQSIDEFLSLKEDNSKLQEYATFLKINKQFKEENKDFEIFLSEENEEINLVKNNLEQNLPVETEKLSNEQPITLDLNNTDSENSESENFESEMTESKNLEHELYEEAASDEVIMLDVVDEIEEEETGIISEIEVEKLELKHQEERKFRLSNIKGVKKMETLFEDDFFGETKTLVEEVEIVENTTKSNVSLDFMEAEIAKPVFKLDLNDRIAFTKKLFAGSQTDLNNAVNRLNNFQTLDEAKEYLSEIYYEKGWDKEDEFAQRLWNLVESKFQ